ncbi:DUF4291 domain-containing protein [Armatimonas sp.]|uniref:DUF4291 domain-containing protein n=1 Tax=Armatimonas sp. TaxID=1872638 RepID=UPI0037521EBD
MSTLVFEPYLDQLARWPVEGKLILAQFDEHSVVVYQAFRPEIALYAVEHQRFGGPFSLERMSWIKPGFLWMMYRSGWASKPGQEHILAVRLRREGFDAILLQAIASTYHSSSFGSREEWQHAVAHSEVRLQWDPDHDPKGNKQTRRAIQLGLRGDILRRYATTWILEISDITAFAHEQAPKPYEDLLLPREEIYHAHQVL